MKFAEFEAIPDILAKSVGHRAPRFGASFDLHAWTRQQESSVRNRIAGNSSAHYAAIIVSDHSQPKGNACSISIFTIRPEFYSAKAPSPIWTKSSPPMPAF